MSGILKLTDSANIGFIQLPTFHKNVMLWLTRWLKYSSAAFRFMKWPLNKTKSESVPPHSTHTESNRESKQNQNPRSISFAPILILPGLNGKCPTSISAQAFDSAILWKYFMFLAKKCVKCPLSTHVMSGVRHVPQVKQRDWVIYYALCWTQ